MDVISDLCKSSNFTTPIKYVGWVVGVIKFVVPVIIIVFGMIDFFKMLTSSKGDNIIKPVQGLLIRIVAGIIIFFVPYLIHYVFSMIDDWNDYESHYSSCTKCLFDPGSC